MAKAKNKLVEDNSGNDLEHVGFRFFASIGRFSVKWRWPVLVFWIIALILIVGHLPSLGSVTQSNNEDFLPHNSPTEQALNIESAFEPSTLVSVPVVIASNGQLTSADKLSVGEIQTSLSHVSSVKHVVNRGESSDGEAEILEVQAESGSSNQNPTKFINDLKDAINKVSVPSDLQVHLTGDLAVAADNANGSNKQNTDLQLGTVIFIIVLLLLIFRAPLAPIITLIPPLLVVTAAGPIIAEAAKHGLKVSSLAQLLLTVLVLGAGTDYGLFLIFRVREELEGGLDSREAIIKALSRVGESITFSAATVVAALLSLLAATFQIYSNLGIPLAIGVVIMLFAGLTLLPALLAIFGRAAFWPTKPQNRKEKRIGLWSKLSGRIVQKPVLVLSIGVIVFVALALAVPGYHAGGFGGQTTAPSGSDSAKGSALLAKHFPSNDSNPTSVLFVFNKSIWDDTAPIVQATGLLNKSNEFNHVTGPLNPNGLTLTSPQLLSLYATLGSPWNLPPIQPAQDSSVSPRDYQAFRATAAYISPDGKTIQYAVGLAVGDPSTTAAMNAVPKQRAEVQQIANEVHAKASAFLGESSVFYDISNISNKDLLRVIPLAVIVIGLLLAFLLRSLVAPIYLVASVVLSYLASLGMSVLIFMDLGGQTGIVFILPFLMFIFLLALGEDYNILVMTRIREEAHTMPLKQAVRAALEATGTTVTSAGLVLAGTFGVLGAISTGPGNQQVREIGFGLAIGILMDTFLVRTLLVPSVVVLLGKWNWWPSKHGNMVDQED